MAGLIAPNGTPEHGQGLNVLSTDVEGDFMQIQLNTDKHIAGSPLLLDHVQKTLEHELRHVAGDVTRVEVHLNDLNSSKTGGDDKRCQLEARVAGIHPISVENRASSIHVALKAAAEQLARAVKTSLAKAGHEGKGGATIKHMEQEPVDVPDDEPV